MARRKPITSASIGKQPVLAPYSGAMFAATARCPTESPPRPGPKYSTNSPDTPMRRSRCVSVSAASVASTPSGSDPRSRTPITSGRRSDTGTPNIAPSASIPPTPQPSTPRALTIGVWLSVPTSVSGTAHSSPRRSSVATTVASRSMLIVCMMPVPGGNTRKPRTAEAAHFMKR